MTSYPSKDIHINVWHIFVMYIHLHSYCSNYILPCQVKDHSRETGSSYEKLKDIGVCWDPARKHV